MPTIKVKTGPYKGWKGTSLLDLIADQDERMAHCPHRNQKTEAGTAGSGLTRNHWKRQRCLDCGACVSNEPSVSDPDFLRQREFDAYVLRKMNEQLDKNTIISRLYLIERKHPTYGWSPVEFYDNYEARNRRAALERLLDRPVEPQDWEVWRVTIETPRHLLELRKENHAKREKGIG